MKDKRPIAEQVAQMTAEQKQMVLKIYKKHLMISLLIVTIFVAAIVPVHIMCMDAQADLEEINEEVEEIGEENKKLRENGGFSLELSEKYSEAIEKELDAMDEYDKWFLIRSLVCVIGGITLVVFALVSKKHYEKKYPFYSEKRYAYIKKMKQ